jgi:uncharacterized protein (TIGR02145 family)
MVLVFLLFTLLFSCSSLELDNPNDPRNKKGSGEQSSSSAEANNGSPSSSSKVPSSSSASQPSSSSSYVPVGLCDPETVVKSTFTDDRDGIEYKAVKICSQTWMAENLNYTDGGVCYDNDQSNCGKYGRLYDWAMAMGIDAIYNNSEWNGSDAKHRGICPEGWHIPSETEWVVLKNYVGNNEGTKLKATDGWNWDEVNNRSGNGTDTYGFSALPGGSKPYVGIGNGTTFWSSTNDTPRSALRRDLDYDKEFFGSIGVGAGKTILVSIRCVKDE